MSEEYAIRQQSKRRTLLRRRARQQKALLREGEIPETAQEYADSRQDSQQQDWGFGE